jgi:hypothetical protein
MLIVGSFLGERANQACVRVSGGAHTAASLLLAAAARPFGGSAVRRNLPSTMPAGVLSGVLTRENFIYFLQR